MSPNYFTLHQKKPGDAYQACFCYLGMVKWWGTGTPNEREATRRAREKQDEILKELALQAALEGKAIPGQDPAAPLNKPTSPGSEVPELDESKPAPKGSFREKIEAQLKFVLGNKPSRHAQRDATDSQKHLYEALGGYVDLPIKQMNGGMGDRLAAFFNNPARFRLCSENYATIMRRFLKPMLEPGLPAEFFAALDKVKRQSHDDEASDPFMADHFKRIALRLETNLEEDYLTGLHLIGCNAGPQVRDSALLRWEGVDFGSETVKLYRGKTFVVANFKMSKPLKAWLWKRRREASPDHVYVFWELACLKGDRGKPDFNQTLEAEDRASSVSTLSGTLWREFMHRAGVPVDLMTLMAGDIIDLKGFIDKVRSKAVPHYAWFFNRCKKSCQKALLKGAATEQELKALEELLIRNLNLIIQGKYAYDEKLFDEIELRGQTREVMNPEYTGVRLYTFHRLLLEDLFPELRRVQFSNYNYSYSSYRKSLVSFLRGLGFRDPVIAKILGQDALDSQNAYDRVAEHELKRGCDVAERHVEAMTKGEPEFYPSIPLDFFEKMMEQFGVQEKARLQLIEEYRRLVAEAEERAQQRHLELMQAVQQSGHETQGMITHKLEEIDGRTQDRLTGIEAGMRMFVAMRQQIIESLPHDVRMATRALFIALIQFVLVLVFSRTTDHRRPLTKISATAPVLGLGPPGDDRQE